MRDSSSRYHVETVSSALGGNKRLGAYLIEAGLITPAQVDVVLNDQQVTGMRFGEILATRGWVKQQTIEYLMQKVIVPERESAKQAGIAYPDKTRQRSQPTSAPRSTSVSSSAPRDDVSWAG